MLASFKPHEINPAVAYRSEQRNGHLYLIFRCQICGNASDVLCSGHKGMPRYRLNEYANQHTHGRFPLTPNPHPRYARVGA